MTEKGLIKDGAAPSYYLEGLRKLNEKRSSAITA
jgi:hypothetical protein